MPVPDSWTLEETEEQPRFPTITNLSEIGGPDPEGYIEKTYSVPASYTLTDLEAWLEGPGWEGSGDDAFGAIEREGCNTKLAQCEFTRVPPSGQQPGYFITAELDEPAYDGEQPTVTVRLDYRTDVESNLAVSPETAERAQSIPVPSDWSLSRTTSQETDRGEEVTQYYAVPEGVSREDVEAWLTGSTWTDPATGEPFGALEVDSPPCRTLGPDKVLQCSATVAGTQSGPVESLSVSLDADRTVRVDLERNG